MRRSNSVSEFSHLALVLAVEAHNLPGTSIDDSFCRAIKPHTPLVQDTCLIDKLYTYVLFRE